MWIEHIIMEDGDEINTVDYPLNYLKKEVKNMFQHFKSNKNEIRRHR